MLLEPLWIHFGSILNNAGTILPPFFEHRFCIDFWWSANRFVEPSPFRNKERNSKNMFWEKLSSQNRHRFCIRFCLMFSWFEVHVGIISSTLSASVFASILDHCWTQNGSQDRPVGPSFSIIFNQKGNVCTAVWPRPSRKRLCAERPSKTNFHQRFSILGHSWPIFDRFCNIFLDLNRFLNRF